MDTKQPFQGEPFEGGSIPTAVPVEVLARLRRILAPPAFSWVPTLYVAEGIPFAMVIWVAGTMFKDLGYSDGSITVGTASIGIAWSLKPLWAPFLDTVSTKRRWILAMQFALSVLFAVAGLALHAAHAFHWTLALLWVIAFASATHDVCADGVYMTALDEKRQAEWIGVQGLCWTVGRLVGVAVIVWFAGLMQRGGRSPLTAWTWGLGLCSAVMGALAIYHYFALPPGSIPVRAESTRIVFSRLMESMTAFFRKKAIAAMLAFVFTYRMGEGFLLVEAPLFMQATRPSGGLALLLGQKALIDGTVGTVASLVGGLAGGQFVARFGLRRVLLFLALCLNVPHVCYVILSQTVTHEHAVPMVLVAILVGIEKFGYSFGFVGCMLYMMQQVAPGKYKMTHYAYATALMNLVLVPTEAASGPLAEWLGYKNFFLFVLLASIPSILAAWKAPFPIAEKQ